MISQHDTEDGNRALRLAVGNKVIVIDDRYETASIVNDVLIAVSFIVGSALFFSETTHTAATVLFLIGSVQFLARPAIRLARRVHLRRLGDTGRRVGDYDY